MDPKWKRMIPGSVEKVSPSAPGGSQEAPRGLLEARWKRILENDGFKARKLSNTIRNWTPFGSQNGPKTDQKSMQKSIQILMVFGIGFLVGFCSIFGPKMEPNWHQNGFQNRCQLRNAVFQKILKNK